MPFDTEITTKSRGLIVLEKARAALAAAPALGRGSCVNPNRIPGSLCLLDALGVAIGRPEMSAQPAHLLDFSGYEQAYRWNDAPGRTKAEVLARFDAAIAKLSVQ